MKYRVHSSVPLLVLLSAVGVAEVPQSGEYGPTPTIDEPQKQILPTLNIAKAVGWQPSEQPTAAAGLKVEAWRRGLQHPRWLYVLPNGDVLVAESEAPPKPEDSKGLSGKIHAQVMKRAGSGESPSANRITLLRNVAGRQGEAERHLFIDNLNSPIGMAVVGERLFIADSDALLSVPYKSGQTEIKATPVKVTDLPGGEINHHWTKTLIASADGRYLYVGVGSNSNAGENGLPAEAERAAVWRIEVATGRHEIYASGLRNPVGLAFEPQTKVLWVAVNERDELGDALPPDYITGLKEGGFYGWPFSYYGQHVDQRVKPQNPDLVAKAIAPDFALGAHTASLGLCWSGGERLAPELAHGMFVGQHGSWNRHEYSGYKVVFVPFEQGKPAAAPMDILTGFLSAKNEARGRPVGVAIDHQGALLVADDVGNTVWKVSRAGEHETAGLR